MGKLQWKRILSRGGLFLLLLGITAFLLFRGQDPTTLFSAIGSAKLPWLMVGLGCMLLFLCCEAYNLRTGFSLFGRTVPFFSCIRYALTGFFFSAVTPSASGGQPMQLYAMYRDGHSPAVGTLALLTELCSFQTAALLLSATGFFLCRQQLLALNRGLLPLLLAGAGLNLIVLTILLCAIFSKRMAPALWHGLMRIARFLRFRRVDQWQTWGETQLAEMRLVLPGYRAHPFRLISMVLVSLLQLIANHSIPFWIYCAFSLTQYNLISVTGLQAVLFVAVSALPLPGGVGISEGGFLLLYRTLFPAALLDGGMVLSRSINFYIPVAVSGLAVALGVLLAKRRLQPDPLPRKTK